MYKIPQNGKWSQKNNSDLFGNLHYTKSVDFDEEGYLKLSSRCVSLINSEDDTDFNIPVSYGRTSTGAFTIATVENPYLLDASNTTLSITKDTDNGDDAPPDMSFNTYGKFYINRWHITTSTKLYYKTISNGNWTDAGITALTSGVSHPIARFEKQGTGSLMIGNGNKIVQLDSTYAVGTLPQLEISSDYEIIGMAYNNNQLGIATRLASTIEGQNQEAGFFTWDGSASSANQMFSVGSDSILAIFPYKSSFIILNRIGQILYFNGGGFDELASFPVYFSDVVWGDFLNKLSYGDSIIVEGDTIFINIKNTVSDNFGGTYLENLLGGIWCYDPAVGLYHRYAPSISKATLIETTQANVNTTTNIITKTAGTVLDTGNPIKVLTSKITPIVAGEIYYIIKASTTSFKLATTKENAIANISVDLTASASGTSAFMALNLKDYGQAVSSRCGGIALMGSKSFSYDKVIFGGEYSDLNSTTNYAHLNLSVFGFKNIGYFITSKLNSSLIEDNIQKLYIKYRPLKSEDSITIKYKNKDFNGIPEYASCTVIDNKTLSHNSYIPNSFASTEELELEILSGAGAGQMTKITSITENSGTYTITLSEELEGISANDVMYVKIDNWNVLDTITSADSENWKEIPLAKNSKWTKFKVVLEGSDISIEELQINNSQFK